MDISVPVFINRFGAFGSAESYSDRWRQRVLSVLLTARRTRVMRPSFGTSLVRPVFENYEQAAKGVKGIVGSAFLEQLPDLKLRKVEVVEQGDETIVIDVWYELPNGQTETLKVGAPSADYGYGA